MSSHIKQIFTGENGVLSSRRILTFLAFFIMCLSWFFNVFAQISVAPYIYDGFLWIVISGLGIVTAGNFGTQWNQSRMMGQSGFGQNMFGGGGFGGSNYGFQPQQTQATQQQVVIQQPVQTAPQQQNSPRPNPASISNVNVTNSSGEVEPDPTPDAPTALE